MNTCASCTQKGATAENRSVRTHAKVAIFPRIETHARDVVPVSPVGCWVVIQQILLEVLRSQPPVHLQVLYEKACHHLPSPVFRRSCLCDVTAMMRRQNIQEINPRCYTRQLMQCTIRVRSWGERRGDEPAFLCRKGRRLRVQ